MNLPASAARMSSITVAGTTGEPSLPAPCVVMPQNFYPLQSESKRDLVEILIIQAGGH